jgi:hypothetical protein
MSHRALYRLLTFHLPNLMSIFLSLGRFSKESVQVRGRLWHFVTSLFFLRCEVPRPTPKLNCHPFSAVHDFQFNVFAVTLHVWRPSPLSVTWRHAMSWWPSTHLAWLIILLSGNRAGWCSANVSDLGWGHTKETGNRNATTIPENCYQTELKTWNRLEQRKFRKG